ncbi:hypothetical protein [Tropicimonas sp. IMCC6043]|uniref:hypothetical protein n=1 Tax=Tropicimonas sp. IMCC6043 TaxID=2510645 RepID=UPI00101C6D3C|nr:hypothetical protein [Tropicimonas sp. IMCC6043]RYH10346.1 hypothetical protein EU800_08630 [Tropicimonas sp. IMCC6043]
METGLYTAFEVSTFWYFGHLTSRTEPPSTAEQLLLGLLCGLTFLARNDAVFVIAALFVVRFLHVQIVGRASLPVALREALTTGVACLAVALPWLAYNKICFGSFMPISGKSQSVSAALGSNLEFIPARLF